jgi:dolichol-phosphate mannosyltransferase
LPTYNERENIAPLIRGVLASAITPHFVLVVDDHSPDGTAEVVEALMREWRWETGDGRWAGEGPIVLIRRVGEKGLTSAIQRGIDEAIYTYGVDIVTWMDCDLSMPPEDIPKLVCAILEQGADLAVGSRWVAGGADVAHGRMARTLSWMINRFATLLLGSQVHDWTSGFVAGRAHVFKQLRLQGDYGEYCIDLLGRAVRNGFRVVEAPYVCVPRTAGASKTGANLWDYLVKGRKYVAAVWQLYIKR